jgi:hypothetical protein
MADVPGWLIDRSPAEQDGDAPEARERRRGVLEGTDGKRDDEDREREGARKGKLQSASEVSHGRQL